MLTVHTMCFEATLEQAKFVAECDNLELTLVPALWGKNSLPSWAQEKINSWSCQTSNNGIYLWQDRQTSGGGCRIVFKDGIVWVSNHSGYAWADTTHEVCEFFLELGCKELSRMVKWSNPFIYSSKESLIAEAKSEGKYYWREGD